MNKIRLITILFLALMAVSACAAIPQTNMPEPTQPNKPTSPPATQPPMPPLPPTPMPGTLSPTDSPSQPGDVTPRGVLAARTALAEKLKLPLDQITVISFTPVDWPDACLGLPAKDEMCAQVITPGYRVLLRAANEVYEARTSGLSQAVRFASQPVAEVTNIGERTRADLALLLRTAPENIAILEVEAMQWPDSCLGIQQAKTACLQVITPGYQVILEYGGKTYTYRTNKTGSVILLETSLPGGPVLPAEPMLNWTSLTQPCRSASLSATAISTGACGLPQQIVQWSNPEHQAQFKHFIWMFASFTAQTPAGRLEFTGMGSRIASPSEQRAIAEWLQIVTEAATTGGAGANAGLALSWHREGGIAGFCDDLVIFRSGVAQASTCRGSAQNLGTVYLSASQLEMLFAWLDDLKPFSQKTSDPAKADAMTTLLLLNGTGSKEANESQKQSMILLAQDVFSSISRSSK